MTPDTKRARELADQFNEFDSNNIDEGGNILRALADEVERLQAIPRGTATVIDNAAYQREREEVWKPLLEAAKLHQWMYDEIGLEQMRKALARAEKALEGERGDG